MGVDQPPLDDVEGDGVGNSRDETLPAVPFVGVEKNTGELAGLGADDLGADAGEVAGLAGDDLGADFWGSSALLQWHCCSMRDRLDKHIQEQSVPLVKAKIRPLLFKTTHKLYHCKYSYVEDDTENDTENDTSTSSTCSIKGVTDFKHPIVFVHPDSPTAGPTQFGDRGILAPTNMGIDQIRNLVLG